MQDPNDRKESILAELHAQDEVASMMMDNEVME